MKTRGTISGTIGAALLRGCRPLAMLALAGLCASCRHTQPAAAAPSGFPPGSQIECDLQVVSLPEALATPLAESLRDPQRVEGAFNELQKHIAAKRAILVGWPILTTKNGDRAVAQQDDELRFRKEGTPPSGFETEKAGVSLMISPEIADDGEHAYIGIDARSVRMLEWTKVTSESDFFTIPDVPDQKDVSEWETEHRRYTIDQPRLSKHEVKDTVIFRNGERKLIGVSKVPKPEGHVELFILHVEAR